MNRLGRLRDDELLAAVARLVAQDRELTAELLAHLGELDERGTCIELGFSSLFAYCTRQLGFCNSSAGQRVAGARACRKFPVALQLMTSGALNLTSLCAVARHLNSENAHQAVELFTACSFKSTREVEELLAARFPQPDAPDSIRRLPTRKETITPCAGSTGDVRVTVASDASVCTTTAEGFGRVDAVTPADAARQILETPPSQAPARTERPARKLEPLSADRFGVHFTADTAFRDLLEEVRALASYRQPGDLLSLMRAGLEAYRRELERSRFKVGKERRGKGRAKAQPDKASPSTRDTPGTGDAAVSFERVRSTVAASVDSSASVELSAALEPAVVASEQSRLKVGDRRPGKRSAAQTDEQSSSRDAQVADAFATVEAAAADRERIAAGKQTREERPAAAQADVPSPSTRNTRSSMANTVIQAQAPQASANQASAVERARSMVGKAESGERRAVNRVVEPSRCGSDTRTAADSGQAGETGAEFVAQDSASDVEAAVPLASDERCAQAALEARQSALVGRAGAGASSPASPYVPADVAREVYERDGGCCTFVAADGRRCGERAFLETDHVEPRAAGGKATPGNLRLRCRAHNQLHARRCFGRRHIRKAIERVRARKREGEQAA